MYCKSPDSNNSLKQKTRLDYIYVNSEQINVSGEIARLELVDYLPAFALIPKLKDKIPKICSQFF